jgi:hypothetical protein
MTGYTREQAALWTAATQLADRGFRIAMVQLGWQGDAKAMLRPPPSGWHTADPFPSTQVKAAIDAGCNAYLWRLPDGWFAVDADTAELRELYTTRLGAPDVLTPRGAHWVVDAPAAGQDRLDTGMRALYGPGSYYPGPDGLLREYAGQVPAGPRQLPPDLIKRARDLGSVTPGRPTVKPRDEAYSIVAAKRAQWLTSQAGSRHEVLMDFGGTLARVLLADGRTPDEVCDALETEVAAHPDSAVFETAEKDIQDCVRYAMANPWVFGTPPGFDGRFAAPDPGEAPALADVGDGGELFAPGDDEFYDNPPPPPEPVYGSFGGKLSLFYDTGVHWLQGESESGKSWVGFEVVREVLSSGGWAIVVDHEDTRGSVLRRFKALGMTREEYRRLVYVSGPDVTHAELRAHLAGTERDYAVMLVDGVTSALSAAGLSGRDEQELTRWVDQLPRQARMSICIDHVVKATDDRQGMAIGSQAKKAVVTGSAWEVVCTSAFGRGRDGRIELRPQKDKGGFLRGELGRTAVRLEFKSGDGGDRVRLEAGAAGEGFFSAPDDALFAALFADGIDGGIGSNELAREAKQRGAGYSTNRKADKHRAWLAYYSERMAVTESRSVSGLP